MSGNTVSQIVMVKSVLLKSSESSQMQNTGAGVGEEVEVWGRSKRCGRRGRGGQQGIGDQWFHNGYVQLKTCKKSLWATQVVCKRCACVLAACSEPWLYKKHQDNKRTELRL